jgi:hypothetical protein
METTAYTAKNVLDNLIWLLHFEPNIKKWNEADLKHHKPALVRFNMLEIAADLFNYGSAQNLATGKFISNKLQLYKQHFLEATMPNSLGWEINQNSAGELGYYALYTGLLHFKIKLDSLLNFNKNYEGQSGFEIALLQKYTSNVLNMFSDPSANGICLVLAAIIDPLQKSYTLSTLIKEHNFPDVDVEALDYEWL